MPGNGTVLPWGVRPAEAAAQPLAAMPLTAGVCLLRVKPLLGRAIYKLCKPIG